MMHLINLTSPTSHLDVYSFPKWRREKFWGQLCRQLSSSLASSLMRPMTEAACFSRNYLRPPARRWHTLQALVTVESSWPVGALLACAVAGRRDDAFEHKHKAGLRSRSRVNCSIRCPMLLAIGFSQQAVTRKAAASQHSLHLAVLIMEKICKYFSSWGWQSGWLGQGEGNKGRKLRTGRTEFYQDLHSTTKLSKCSQLCRKQLQVDVTTVLANVMGLH